MPPTAVQLLTHLPMDLPWTQPTWLTHITGWWLSHPSEKYEFVSWGYYSQLNGNSQNSCSKPPTRLTDWGTTLQNIRIGYKFPNEYHQSERYVRTPRFLYACLSNFLVFHGRTIPFFPGTSLVEARDVVTVGQTEIFELRNPLPWVPTRGWKAKWGSKHAEGPNMK